MLWGIGGLIALAVGFFIGLGGFLAPLALFLGIVGVTKERESIAAWLSAIGGFIGFAVVLITVAGAENTVANFFVSLWDFLVLCFAILLAIIIPIGFALYPLVFKKPLAETAFGIFILLAITSMCAWLGICMFWIDNKGKALGTAEICFGLFFITTAIAFVINLIHSIYNYCKQRKLINSNNELRIKYNKEKIETAVGCLLFIGVMCTISSVIMFLLGCALEEIGCIILGGVIFIVCVPLAVIGFKHSPNQGTNNEE